MASSFITKDNEYGFWVEDNLFEVVCRYLHLSFKDLTIVQNEGWIVKFIELLDNNAKGFFHSYMHLDLDDLIIDEMRKKVLKNILSTTKKLIHSKGSNVSISELLNLFETGQIAHEWVKPLPTARLIQVINYLEDLIDDRLLFKMNDNLHYDL